jgi:tetratricopeptide (TPR) repeat protein
LVSSDATARVWLWQSAGRDRVEELEQEVLLRRTNEYLTSRRWQDAVDLCSHLLERDGDLYWGDQLFEREKLFRRRGRALAEQGRWDEAVADLGQAINSDKRDFYTSRTWYELAVARLALGDQEGYRETCADMLDKFGETENSLIASFVAWTCALAPDAVEDYEPVLACAANAVEAQPTSDQSFNSLGAILYRTGRLEDAIEWLTELDHPVDGPDAKESSAPAYTWYVLAMAHKKAGNKEQAREYLNRANAWSDVAVVDEADPSPWNRLATLELLRNEAEALLGISETDRKRLVEQYNARTTDEATEAPDTKPKKEGIEAGDPGGRRDQTKDR